jgi:predicted nucleic acid-binding protein
VRSSRVDHGCVLDSSAALALTLDEPGAAAVARLIASQVSRRARLVAPRLFDVECAGALVKAVRRRRLDEVRALDDLLDLLDLPVERLHSPAYVYSGLGLALKYGISAYDAVYVALAAEERLPLVTADARLVRALAGSPHVALHLDDVEL